MGFDMGRVQVVEHDGQGKLSVTNLPFVVMRDWGADLDLGLVRTRTW